MRCDGKRKQCGNLFYKILIIDMLQTYPGLDPTHLLEKDELKSRVKELEILYFCEIWI